jgi:hypothetical protein
VINIRQLLVETNSKAKGGAVFTSCCHCW